MKNLIVGAVDMYSWNEIRIWAESLVRTEFSGDVVLLAYRVNSELMQNCQQLGIRVVQAQYDAFGNEINHSQGNIPTQIHKMRTFHTWQLLNDFGADDYEFVAITDTRDIVFQRNPDDFFSTLSPLPAQIMMPSENILIGDEFWNLDMITHMFGPYVADNLSDKHSCNSGTVFGKLNAMKNLMLQINMITRSTNRTGTDQPAMNFIGHLPLSNGTINVLPHDAGWACQCGTTLDQSKPALIQNNVGPAPMWDGSTMCNQDGTPFVIVHQYDRVPELKHAIEGAFN